MELVFDLDGVLLDSEGDLSWLDRALSGTLRSFDLPDTEANRRRLYPATIPSFEDAAASLGIDAEALWTVRNRRYLEEKLAAMETGEIGPFDDVEVLRPLAAEYPMHIISNSPQAVVDRFREDGHRDLFRVGIGRGSRLADLAHLKPATTFADRLRERTAGSDFLYVGDLGTDRRFAANAGWDYVHLDRSTAGLDVLRERLG